MTTKIIVIVAASVATVLGMIFLGKLTEGKNTEQKE